MITASDLARIAQFRELIAAQLGLDLDETKEEVLADTLRLRTKEAGAGSVAAYLQALADGERGLAEWRILAELLTVGETYFFRNRDHFRVVAEVSLAELAGDGAEERPLRVLSAGCASGEEAYSLAMVIRDRLPDGAARRASIVGIDINRVLLDKANRARYSSWSLRETLDTAREQYFVTDGREYVPIDSVRKLVSFEERNLVHDHAEFWRPGAFDIVFCRNVIMYLSPAAREAVVARICRSLVPGGFLFLGHAETLRGVSQDFHLRHTHEAFYYQTRRQDEAKPVAEAATWSVSSLATTAPARSEPANDESWVDVIRRGGERIATLAQRAGSGMGNESRPERAADVGSQGRAPVLVNRQLGVALELLQRERFGDAIEHLRSLSPELMAGSDAQLLQAVLLTNSGNLDEAESVCKKLLAHDELNVGAHYLMALCREQVADHEEATRHDQTAVYLDPTFAMPRLHMGLLARRAGDGQRARRELNQALILLATEDVSRILLFGGGFSREALLRLCRAELRAIGDKP